jgi:hypothetical protein
MTSKRLSVNSHRRTWRRYAPGLRRLMPSSGISNLRRTWLQAGLMLSRRRPYRISKKGGVLICETPRNTTLLGLLSSAARRCAASGRPLLCRAAPESPPSIAAFQAGRTLLVCPCRHPLPRRGRGTRGQYPLVLDRRACRLRQVARAGVGPLQVCTGSPTRHRGWGAQSSGARTGNRQELFGGLTYTRAEQSTAPDCLQRPLRSRFRQQVSASVLRTDPANTES